MREHPLRSRASCAQGAEFGPRDSAADPDGLMGATKSGQDAHSLLYGFTALLALLAALLLSALALSPPADAHIYWTTKSGNIGRANLDGTGANSHFISGAAVYPSAVSVYGRHIYWADTNRDTIGRANLDGTGVNRTFLSFPDSPFVFRPHDIAIGAGHIYWANWSTFIGRAKIDGTHAQLKFIRINNKRFSPGRLAVNARHIYWTGMAFEEPNAIGRANLDGTGVRNNFITSKTSPFSLAIGGRHIYWTTPTNAIVRAKLDGTGVRPKFITTDKGQPGSIAAGGGHIYWTNWAYWTNPVNGELGSGWIARANLDGTGVQRFVAAGSEEESPTDVGVG